MATLQWVMLNVGSRYGGTNILISTSRKNSLGSQCECNFVVRWHILHPSHTASFPHLSENVPLCKAYQITYFWFGRFFYPKPPTNETEFKPSTQPSSSVNTVPVYSTAESLQWSPAMFLGIVHFYRIPLLIEHTWSR